MILYVNISRLLYIFIVDKIINILIKLLRKLLRTKKKKKKKIIVFCIHFINKIFYYEISYFI